jgi:iron(III) transport system substrate-binding protein
VKGLVFNLAREPLGNDRGQMKAIVLGQAYVTVVDTYCLGQMLFFSNDEVRKVAMSLGLIFPNQNDRGTHITMSGASILKHASNKANALLLLRFLLSTPWQEFLSASNFEYPVMAEAAVPDLLKCWGNSKHTQSCLICLTAAGADNSTYRWLETINTMQSGLGKKFFFWLLLILLP